MREFSDEYGYFSSGVFALALSQVLELKLVAIQAHNFVIHVCCSHEDHYLDAFGISGQSQLLQRVGYEYQRKDISLRYVSREFVSVMTKHKPEELTLAMSVVESYLRKVSLPKALEERRKCVEI